jgi:DNA polymerase III epsilon subunit-like protein
MQYVSIDLETTGLSDQCQILEIGAVFEDSKRKLPYEEIPKFQCLVKHPVLIAEPEAYKMNKKLIEDIYIKNVVSYTPEEAVELFRDFLIMNGANKDGVITINVAGKNIFAFDINFLRRLPNWDKYIRVRYRHLDPAQFFIDWDNDTTLPSMQQCKNRAFQMDGFEGANSYVSHRALYDAWDVVTMLRLFY